MIPDLTALIARPAAGPDSRNAAAPGGRSGMTEAARAFRAEVDRLGPVTRVVPAAGVAGGAVARAAPPGDPAVPAVPAAVDPGAVAVAPVLGLAVPLDAEAEAADPGWPDLGGAPGSGTDPAGTIAPLAEPVSADSLAPVVPGAEIQAPGAPALAREGAVAEAGLPPASPGVAEPAAARSGAAALMPANGAAALPQPAALTTARVPAGDAGVTVRAPAAGVAVGPDSATVSAAQGPLRPAAPPGAVLSGHLRPDPGGAGPRPVPVAPAQAGPPRTPAQMALQFGLQEAAAAAPRPGAGQSAGAPGPVLAAPAVADSMPQAAGPLADSGGTQAATGDPQAPRPQLPRPQILAAGGTGAAPLPRTMPEGPAVAAAAPALKTPAFLPPVSSRYPALPGAPAVPDMAPPPVQPHQAPPGPVLSAVAQPGPPTRGTAAAPGAQGPDNLPSVLSPALPTQGTAPLPGAQGLGSLPSVLPPAAPPRQDRGPAILPLPYQPAAVPLHDHGTAAGPRGLPLARQGADGARALTGGVAGPAAATGQSRIAAAAQRLPQAIAPEEGVTTRPVAAAPTGSVLAATSAVPPPEGLVARNAGPSAREPGPLLPPAAVRADSPTATATPTPDLSSPDLLVPDPGARAAPADLAAALPEPGLAPPGSTDSPRGAGTTAPAGHPPPAQHAPPQASAADLARQIAAVDLGPGGTVTELRLDPAELGSLRLSLATLDGAVTLTITAERPETADLARRHAADLAAELRALGYQEVNLAFGQGGQADGGRQDAQADDSSPLMVDAAPVHSPASAQQNRPAAGSALDLRL